MVKREEFGVLDGTPVEKVLLTNGTIELECITFGAAVRALRVPDRTGVMTDVVLGYDRPQDYRDMDSCVGGIVGRYANRIGGASFPLNGETVRLTANEGANQLHGGFTGFHKKHWAIADTQENSVTFRYVSPDGEEGFPGALTTDVTYRLEGDTVRIDFAAASTRDTVASLTNHAYFNLAGHSGGPITEHILTLRAERYTPCGGPGHVPNGEVSPVEGTPLDLREPTVLGERLKTAFLVENRGFDHNYVLSGGEKPAAELYCPRTGIGMELTTTLPGMQLYSAGFLGERTGKDGVVYGPAHAVCLEPQHFPNAVNHPSFPSPFLKAGDTYRESITWKFYSK